MTTFEYTNEERPEWEHEQHIQELLESLETALRNGVGVNNSPIRLWRDPDHTFLAVKTASSLMVHLTEGEALGDPVLLYTNGELKVYEPGPWEWRIHNSSRS